MEHSETAPLGLWGLNTIKSSFDWKQNWVMIISFSNPDREHYIFDLCCPETQRTAILKNLYLLKSHLKQMLPTSFKNEKKLW